MKKFAEGGEGKKKMLISLLFLNSMVTDKDGRSSLMTGEDQVSYDDEGKTAEEIRLENILECIAGVGEVHVMIRSSEESPSASVFLSGDDEEKGGEVKGVIVAAEGAENPVIQSKIQCGGVFDVLIRRRAEGKAACCLWSSIGVSPHPADRRRFFAEGKRLIMRRNHL